MTIWLLVLFAVVLVSANHNVSTITQSIVYHRLGPQITCPEGIAAINNYFSNQSINPSTNQSLSYSSLPVFTLGITVSLTGWNEEKKSADADVPMVLQLALDWINSRGGVTIDPSIKPSNNGTKYLLSVVYTDDQSSPAMSRLIHADMMNHGIELFMGSFGDDTQQAINKLIRSLSHTSDESLNLSTFADVTIVTSVAWERQTFDTQLGNQSFTALNHQLINPAIYLFGVRGLTEQLLFKALHTLSDLIQHQQLVNQSGPQSAVFDHQHADDVPSVRSICMFSTSTSSGRSLRLGVLAWIDSINQSHNHSIRLVLDDQMDLSFNKTVCVQRWLSCPSDADLVLMPYSPIAATYLQQSKRRFGAVMDFEQQYEEDDNLPISAGWIRWRSIVSSTEPIGFMLPSALDFSIMYYLYTSVINELTNKSLSVAVESPYTYLRLLTMSCIMQAFNQSVEAVNPLNQTNSTTSRLTNASLNHFAFRQAMFSLTGNTFIGTTSFNRTNGLNDGSVDDRYMLFQTTRDDYLDADDSLSANQSTRLLREGWTSQSIEFPYDWSWPDESLDRFIIQDPIVCLFALLSAGIGSWLAFLLYERSMLNVPQRGKQSTNRSIKGFCFYQIMCAYILTNVGIVITQMLLAVSTSVLPTDAAVQPSTQSGYESNRFCMFYSVSAICLCIFYVLVAFLLISDGFPALWLRFLALCSRTWRRVRPTVRIVPINSPSAHPSVSRSQKNVHAVTSFINPLNLHRCEDATACLQQRERQMNQLTLASSRSQELLQLLEFALQPRFIIAAVLVASAIQGSRGILFSAWRLQLIISTPVHVWLIKFIFNVLLWSFGLSCLRHAFKWRIPAVFMLAADVVLDWEIQALTAKFTYDSKQTINHSVMRWDYAFAADTVILSAAVTVIVMSLAAVLTQYIGMRTSHRALRAVVSSTERELARVVERKTKSELELQMARASITAMFSTLQAITLAIHIPQEFALACALYHGQTSVSEPGTSSALIRMRRLLQRTAAIPDKESLPTAFPVARPSMLNMLLSPATTPPAPVRRLPRNSSARRSLTNIMQRQPSGLFVDPRPSLAHTETPSQSSISLRRMRRTTRASASTAEMIPSRHSVDVKRLTPIRHKGSPSSLSLTPSPTSPPIRGRVMTDNLTSPSKPIKSSSVNNTILTPTQEIISHAENLLLAALEAQNNIVVCPDVKFSLCKSLAGPRSDAEIPIPRLTLRQILSHPACVEVFKQELIKYHSLENLTFFLLARRYRALSSHVLRKLLVSKLFQHFIQAGAPEEINLSTSQRMSIELKMKQQTYEPDLFLEAERECFHLMEVNIFEKFSKDTSPGYRLTCWLYMTISIDDLPCTWLTGAT